MNYFMKGSRTIPMGMVIEEEKRDLKF